MRKLLVAVAITLACNEACAGLIPTVNDVEIHKPDQCAGKYTFHGKRIAERGETCLNGHKVKILDLRVGKDGSCDVEEVVYVDLGFSLKCTLHD